jgi:hypothetical protein
MKPVPLEKVSVALKIHQTGVVSVNFRKEEELLCIAQGMEREGELGSLL